MRRGDRFGRQVQLQIDGSGSEEGHLRSIVPPLADSLDLFPKKSDENKTERNLHPRKRLHSR